MSPVPAVLTAAQVIEVTSPEGDAWWVTALVAVGAALLGATVGGFASFQANERLERRRRAARAAIRRKAKVYTPVRSELLALQESMEDDDHLESGISASPPKLDGFDRGPRVFRWREMKADGRALTAASAEVGSKLDDVDDSIDALNEERESSSAVIDVRGRALFEVTTGAPTTLVHWVHGGELTIAVRGRIEETHLFGIGTEQREKHVEEIEHFAKAFKADPDVSASVQRVISCEERLRGSVQDAITTLDKAMTRIGNRYEGETPTD